MAAFSSLQKKNLTTSLQNKICLKKVPDPTFLLTWYDFGHMAVADCATFAMWQIRSEVELGTFLKQKNFAGMFFNFFCRNENQNTPKLQGRNAYLSQFF